MSEAVLTRLSAFLDVKYSHIDITKKDGRWSASVGQGGGGLVGYGSTLEEAVISALDHWDRVQVFIKEENAAIAAYRAETEGGS